MKNKEPELILIKESLAGSIISDCFTFAIMLGAFWVNYKYIGNSIMMQIIITVTIIAMAIKSLDKTTVTVCGKKNIIKFLQEYTSDENLKKDK